MPRAVANRSSTSTDFRVDGKPSPRAKSRTSRSGHCRSSREEEQIASAGHGASDKAERPPDACVSALIVTLGFAIASVATSRASQLVPPGGVPFIGAAGLCWEGPANIDVTDMPTAMTRTVPLPPSFAMRSSSRGTRSAGAARASSERGSAAVPGGGGRARFFSLQPKRRTLSSLGLPRTSMNSAVSLRPSQASRPSFHVTFDRHFRLKAFLW
mmetsp:Transcript_10704/g.34045  ORF Transcript_10704/g.34045 Transcript_10704/m.34045 type:complete len:213 (-) Transcript_10704:379-1017(-)